jgi:hypothetical protein
MLGSFTGEGDNLAALLGADLDWAAGAGHIRETLVQRQLGEGNGSEGEPAVAPEADSISLKVKGAGNLGVVLAISSGEDDVGAKGNLLGQGPATQERLKVVAHLRREVDRWRFWTSHKTNSQF